MLAKIKGLLQQPEFQKLIKFGLTGAINTLVDFAVFALCRRFFLLGLTAAQILGYGAGMLNSYAINRRWTFATREKFLSAQLLRFVLLNAAMMALSAVLINALAAAGMHELWGKGVTTILILFVNFFLSRIWVFQSKR